ncbi:hypothetical protein DFJ73DRAFT_769523 [Zopfochytrium polystomum]|nr:hypothetical protein DFJ73DRAFT_769523 [Zopfochytrium polystomum]
MSNGPLACHWRTSPSQVAGTAWGGRKLGWVDSEESALWLAETQLTPHVFLSCGAGSSEEKHVAELLLEVSLQAANDDLKKKRRQMPVERASRASCDHRRRRRRRRLDWQRLAVEDEKEALVGDALPLAGGRVHLAEALVGWGSGTVQGLPLLHSDPGSHLCNLKDRGLEMCVAEEDGMGHTRSRRNWQGGGPPAGGRGVTAAPLPPAPPPPPDSALSDSAAAALSLSMRASTDVEAESTTAAEEQRWKAGRGWDGWMVSRARRASMEQGVEGSRRATKTARQRVACNQPPRVDERAHVAVEAVAVEEIAKMLKQRAKPYGEGAPAVGWGGGGGKSKKAAEKKGKGGESDVLKQLTLKTASRCKTCVQRNVNPHPPRRPSARQARQQQQQQQHLQPPPLAAGDATARTVRILSLRLRPVVVAPVLFLLLAELHARIKLARKHAVRLRAAAGCGDRRGRRGAASSEDAGAAAAAREGGGGGGGGGGAGEWVGETFETFWLRHYDKGIQNVSGHGGAGAVGAGAVGAIAMCEVSLAGQCEGVEIFSPLFLSFPMRARLFLIRAKYWYSTHGLKSVPLFYATDSVFQSLTAVYAGSGGRAVARNCGGRRVFREMQLMPAILAFLPTEQEAAAAATAVAASELGTSASPQPPLSSSSTSSSPSSNSATSGWTSASLSSAADAATKKSGKAAAPGAGGPTPPSLDALALPWGGGVWDGACVRLTCKRDCGGADGVGWWSGRGGGGAVRLRLGGEAGHVMSRFVAHATHKEEGNRTRRMMVMKAPIAASATAAGGVGSSAPRRSPSYHHHHHHHRLAPTAPQERQFHNPLPSSTNHPGRTATPTTNANDADDNDNDADASDLDMRVVAPPSPPRRTNPAGLAATLITAVAGSVGGGGNGWRSRPRRRGVVGDGRARWRRGWGTLLLVAANTHSPHTPHTHTHTRARVRNTLSLSCMFQKDRPHATLKCRFSKKVTSEESLWNNSRRGSPMQTLSSRERTRPGPTSNSFGPQLMPCAHSSWPFLTDCASQAHSSGMMQCGCAPWTQLQPFDVRICCECLWPGRVPNQPNGMSKRRVKAARRRHTPDIGSMLAHTTSLALDKGLRWW